MKKFGFLICFSVFFTSVLNADNPALADKCKSVGAEVIKNVNCESLVSAAKAIIKDKNLSQICEDLAVKNGVSIITASVMCAVLDSQMNTMCKNATPDSLKQNLDILCSAISM